VAEAIPDSDAVSRLLFDPLMGREDEDLIWKNVFQFPTADGQTESVVWRKYAVLIDDAHKLGCAKQSSDRQKEKGRRSTYFGSITGNVGEIRSLKSASGISFTVEHIPQDGLEHAHIGFTPGSQKNDRNSLKVLLQGKFGGVEPHRCP
jgi:hypothetical protein